MSIRISIDFDGVCTDLSFVRKQEINQYEYLFSPFSVTLSKMRKGILEIISVLGLFGEIYILTSRKEEHKPYIENWLAVNNLLPFIKDILCCGEIPKNCLMQQYNISLHIDDDIHHLDILKENQKGILWEGQSWLCVLKDFFRFVIENPTFRLNAEPQKSIISAECTSDLGPSPVFILTLIGNYKLKLRICLNELVKLRILGFLETIKGSSYNHVAKLIDTNGLALLKSFIEGQPINELSEDKRIGYIEKVGIALAKLHKITPNSYDSTLNFSIETENISPLIFSADNYNTVIINNNDIGFIDLEACNIGNRWIDCCWAENLLCLNDKEKSVFYDGYFSIYQGSKPNNDELQLAKQNYKLWLTYQLSQSISINIDNSEKLQTINHIIFKSWNN